MPFSFNSYYNSYDYIHFKNVFKYGGQSNHTELPENLFQYLKSAFPQRILKHVPQGFRAYEIT